MTIAPAVTGRFRSLEGSSFGHVLLSDAPESARLRPLELGSSFVTASAEQRQPMPRWATAKPAIRGRGTDGKKGPKLRGERTDAGPQVGISRLRQAARRM